MRAIHRYRRSIHPRERANSSSHAGRPFPNQRPEVTLKNCSAFSAATQYVLSPRHARDALRPAMRALKYSAQPAHRSRPGKMAAHPEGLPEEPLHPAIHHEVHPPSERPAKPARAPRRWPLDPTGLFLKARIPAGRAASPRRERAALPAARHRGTRRDSHSVSRAKIAMERACQPRGTGYLPTQSRTGSL